MASSWEKKRLGDFISVAGGFSYKGKFVGEGEALLLGMGAVSFNKRFLISGARKYSGNYPDKHLAKVGDLIVATRQQSENLPILGYPAKVPAELASNKVVVGTNLYKVYNDSSLENEFIFWLMRGQQYLKHIKSRATGTTVKMITKDAIEDFVFDCPPPEIRKSIYEFLDAIEDKIELIAKTNQTLEQMAQALFKSWFVDFDPVVDNALAAGNPIPDELAHRVEVRKKAHTLANFQPLPEHIRNLFPSEFEQTGELTVGIGGWVPEGWSVKKLSDLLCVRYGKDHKKLDEGEYPVYGSGGLMRRVDKFLHEGESVLIPRKGTLSNIMYVNEAFWSVDTMFFTIPKMPNVAKFSFFLLKRLNFDSMNVGSAVPSMTTKVLNSLQIVYPTEFILAKFDEILGSYFSKERFNQDNTKQLERIRDTLLPKLISGAISINKEVE